MYTRSWVGVKSYFLRFTMNPARVSIWRDIWTDCFTSWGNSPRMRMSSRYRYSCTPVSLSQATKGARVLLTTRGAEVSLKGIAYNWYYFLSQQNLRYWW